RTPSAVAMKLSNFASLDPEHQRRGVSGLKNASALDTQIMREYLASKEQVMSLAMAADRLIPE
ncbi:MAG: HNH endonuclease, partial [Planctomycetes bacterium]|nr:HNH endonuclease [Planctomycetota bacterium]